jgi:hypothetical protein
MDASENETSTAASFDDGKWYVFRVAVTGERIKVFVEETTKENKVKTEKVIDLEVGEKKISLRDETTEYKPLGICTWTSEGWIRNIQYRKLKPEEIDKK